MLINATQNNIRRINYVDLIESLAIIFVIVYHSPIYSTNILSGGELTTKFSYWFNTILSTCVPLFFFINGFLLFNKDFNLKKHILKIIKLILLTCIWGIITLCLYMLIRNEYFTIKEFIKALWTWKQGWINHLWFMGTLICIYCLFPILKLCYDTNKKIFYYFVILCALLTFGNKLLCEISTLIASFMFDYRKEINVNLFNMFNPIRGIYGYSIVYFCCGGIIYNYIDKIKQHHNTINTLAFFTIIFNMSLLFAYGYYISCLTGKWWDVVWNGYDTIFTFSNVISIFILSLNYTGQIPLLSNFIRILSLNTLGIYFLHWIYIPLTLPFFKQFPSANNILSNFIYAIIITIICLITITFIKKIPLIKHLV